MRSIWLTALESRMFLFVTERERQTWHRSTEWLRTGVGIGELTSWYAHGSSEVGDLRGYQRAVYVKAPHEIVVKLAEMIGARVPHGMETQALILVSSLYLGRVTKSVLRTPQGRIDLQHEGETV